VAVSTEKPAPLVPDSDELLRLIFESAKDFAIFTADVDGQVTSWNPGAERLLGYTEDEIIGRHASIIFPPEHGGAKAEAEERQTALTKGRAEDERWQVRKDGTHFWASGLAMRLEDPAMGLVKILRDRTEAHRTEQRLRQSEELFRVLATNIPQLVFCCERDGDRTWGSPQWTIFTGLDLPHSLQFGWLDAVHPDDREATVAAWEEAQQKGEYSIEHRIRHSADGEYRWFQTRAVPVHGTNLGLDTWVGTSTDIHRLRTLQDEQKVLLTELQHRTRNVLAVVQALARQTLRASSSLEEFGTRFESRLRALSRVQGLLARAEDCPIELRELVEAELKAHGDGAADPGKVVVEGPNAWLPRNSVQALALALHELATNAVKYGALKEPTGKLEVKWQIEGREPDARARITWAESGVRIGNSFPRRKGYGSEMIEKSLPYQLGTETRLEFGEGGVRCEVTVPISTGDVRHE
jgi:PAS domain S-box-containing protein